MGIRKRLDKLEASTPPARTEEEIGARACERLSTEDLLTLEETCRRLLDLGDDWDTLTEEEREAFEQVWRRYQQAKEEARAGR